MLSLEMSHMKLCTKYKAALDYKPRILGPKIEEFPCLVTPGPSKLEKVVDPGSGPRGPLPEIGVHYLVLFSWEILEGHHWCQT